MSGRAGRGWGMVLLLFLVAAVLVGLGLAFLGFPGLFWMRLGSPLAGLFTDRFLPSEGGWPQAIQVSVIWPWFLPLSYLLARAVTGPGFGRGAVTLVLTAAASVVLGAAVQVASGRLAG